MNKGYTEERSQCSYCCHRPLFIGEYMTQSVVHCQGSARTTVTFSVEWPRVVETQMQVTPLHLHPYYAQCGIFCVVSCNILFLSYANVIYVIGLRPSDHYFRNVSQFVCLSVCLCRVFLSRL